MKISEQELKDDAALEVATPTQRRLVDFFRREILNHDGLGSNDYEFKRFDVTTGKGSRLLFVVSTVGRKGDEGTAAQAFCRTTRHICISPRGKCELLNASKRYTKKELRAYPARLCWVLTDDQDRLEATVGGAK